MPVDFRHRPRNNQFRGERTFHRAPIPGTPISRLARVAPNPNSPGCPTLSAPSAERVGLVLSALGALCALCVLCGEIFSSLQTPELRATWTYFLIFGETQETDGTFSIGFIFIRHDGGEDTTAGVGCSVPPAHRSGKLPVCPRFQASHGYATTSGAGSLGHLR
jgi:hypothetical protein